MAGILIDSAIVELDAWYHVSKSIISSILCDYLSDREIAPRDSAVEYLLHTQYNFLYPRTRWSQVDQADSKSIP